MKIALVIPELHKAGGTERCVASLAQALERRGHSFVIFSGRCAPGVLPNARRYWVPLLPRPHFARFFSFFLLNPVVRMLARIRGERADVVFSTGPDVLRPTFTTFHCCSMAFGESVGRAEDRLHAGLLSRLRTASNRLTYRVIGLLESYVACRGAAHALAVSDVLKRELVQFYGPAAERIAVLQNGVDPLEFHPVERERRREIRQRLGFPCDRPVILFVGHNWERKGLGTLVRALTKLRSCYPELRPQLVVVGGSTSHPFAKEARSTLRGDVCFLGTQPDMMPIYNACDVLVLPTSHEPFGLPVLEAMACGIPGIVSQLAGVAELMRDGENGVLLNDAGDADGLAGKMIELLCDSGRRRAMGERASATARQCSWDCVAQQFESMCAQRAALRTAA